MTGGRLNFEISTLDHLIHEGAMIYPSFVVHVSNQMVKFISKHRVNMLIDIECIDHPCMDAHADLDIHYA